MNINLIKSFIWVFIALVIAIVVQIPMLWQGDYTFILPNSIIVVCSVLYIRHTFDFYSLKIHFNKWVKYSIFVFNIFLFIYVLNRLELMMGIIDTMDMSALMLNSNISLAESVDLFQYIHKEYLGFSVFCFVAIAIYNIRLLTSFWKRSKIKRERQLN